MIKGFTSYENLKLLLTKTEAYYSNFSLKGQTKLTQNDYKIVDKLKLFFNSIKKRIKKYEEALKKKK